MTNHFPEAFKRMPTRVKRARSFADMLSMFQDWGQGRAPMTDKQTKALALEARNRDKKPLKATNVYVESKDKRGRTQKYWKDAVTGIRVKGRDDELRLPAWREKDIERKGGRMRNVATGETLVIRNRNGGLKARKDWVLISKRGKEKHLFPELREKKTAKKGASRKSTKRRR